MPTTPKPDKSLVRRRRPLRRLSAHRFHARPIARNVSSSVSPVSSAPTSRAVRMNFSRWLSLDHSSSGDGSEPSATFAPLSRPLVFSRLLVMVPPSFRALSPGPGAGRWLGPTRSLIPASVTPDRSVPSVRPRAGHPSGLPTAGISIVVGGELLDGSFDTHDAHAAERLGQIPRHPGLPVPVHHDQTRRLEHRG